MRKTCVQDVEILCAGSGSEHIMCTGIGCATSTPGVQMPVLAQSNPGIYTAFPHVKNRFLPLLSGCLSPLSTTPITTTTISLT